jgi:hypothetical protein
MVYNSQNYRVFGLRLPHHLRTETEPFSETLSSLVFGIPDNGQSPKP